MQITNPTSSRHAVGSRAEGGVAFGLLLQLPMIATEHPKPKGSNVVPCWVCYGFSARDCNILPKKELHRRVWLNPKPQTLITGMSRKVSPPDHLHRTIRVIWGIIRVTWGNIGVIWGLKGVI